MRTLLAGLAALSLSGCATIFEGTSQSVAVDSDPPGALCKITRAGDVMGSVASTPGSLRVDKSKNDLTIACSKAGYQDASTSQSPRFVGTTFGNIVAGGLVGVIVDASTGANYEYPSQVHLNLAPFPTSLPTGQATPLRTCDRDAAGAWELIARYPQPMPATGWLAGGVDAL